MTHALRLQIQLEEPLLATGIANGEENSSVSLNHIPGSAVRGAYIAAYKRIHNSTDLDSDPIAHKLFFDDSVLFLNGYLALPVDVTSRALPCPSSWHMSKDEGDNERRRLRDYALEIEPYDKSKQEKRAFFWPGIEEPRSLKSPRRWTNVHNASRDPVRKNEENSDVFRYDALDRDQGFVAYVVSDDKTHLDELATCLSSNRLHLGGSQTAGYGLVTIKIDWETSWQESEPDYEVKDVTMITLLSDALLRDEFGRESTDFHQALCLALGKSIPKPDKTFAQTQLVGGFNRKWGLPLPQRWAVAMGSTFVYKVDDLSPDDLLELVAKGIGDRRGEGYGRIGVNLNSLDEFTTYTPKTTKATALPLSPTSETMAQKMAGRWLMREVETAVLSHVQSIQFEKERYPQNTQLSRLRLIVRQAQQENDLGVITKHLQDMKKPAADQFARHRLNVPGEKHLVPWDKWLRDRATSLDGFTQINLNPQDVKWQISGQPPIIDITVNIRVTCLLIEALLRKALKPEEVQHG